MLDLLKFPATLGPATDFVLERVCERFATLNRPNLHLWDIIAWAETTFPNVDLACPPGLPLARTRVHHCAHSGRGRNRGRTVAIGELRPNGDDRYWLRSAGSRWWCGEAAIRG